MDPTTAAILIARSPGLILVLGAHPIGSWPPLASALLVSSAVAWLGNAAALFGRPRLWACAELPHVLLWLLHQFSQPMAPHPAGGLAFAAAAFAFACGTLWMQGRSTP